MKQLNIASLKIKLPGVKIFYIYLRENLKGTKLPQKEVVTVM